MSARRHLKRDEIARAAIGPLSIRGLRNVTLAELGAELGMSGAHLLYYFDSKTDLFASALRMVERDLRAKVEERFAGMDSARDRWDLLLETGAPAGLDDSGLLMWLEAWAEAVHDREMHQLIHELEQDWQDQLLATLRYGVHRGELPGDLDLVEIVEGASALLDGLTIRVVVGYRPLDHRAAMRVVASFLDPLLPWRTPSQHDGQDGQQ